MALDVVQKPHSFQKLRPKSVLMVYDFFRAQPAPAGLQQEDTRSADTFQSWTPSPWVLLISEATEENLQETLNHALAARKTSLSEPPSGMGQENLFLRG
ncbi:Hypothetical predicted protein [Cloeon dipterum]|uniref:Uncharacterized protein n=1 Tax=Cloeon dipterum TaxID=197152 RepID=A0A8S1E9Y2_9INSE|nr:Hypothetical predicted protein [Cloeon dipterum]CAB3389033.1 Hypothetical predicted protein [Cloeon dipterum]